jgi:hypothetical protein
LQAAAANVSNMCRADRESLHSSTVLGYNLQDNARIAPSIVRYNTYIWRL